MKKIIFLLTAIGMLSFAQAQTVTKIFGKINTVPEYTDLSGGDVTLYHQISQIYSVQMNLSFEFTNGSNALEAGDIVIIEGRFTQEPFGEIVPIEVDGEFYDGIQFSVPSQGIAADASYRFNHPYPLQVSQNGVTQEEGRYRATVSARCVYTSADGNMKSTATMLNNTFYLANNTSVNESVISTIKIYPNPATTNLSFTNLKNTDISLYNFVGQEIMTHSNLTGNASIDVSMLTNGIYFVKMKNGTTVRTEKVKIVR